MAFYLDDDYIAHSIQVEDFSIPRLFNRRVERVVRPAENPEVEIVITIIRESYS